MSTIYKNPILSGFNPDPSICRVENDFYLVTSTFEFLPVVPIYHSKNLVDWECIGHCLTNQRQFNLENVKSSTGIYAPTIRYHKGTFFMTTTNVGEIGNFIVHTSNIENGWSEPIKVEQGGIDPSLFFDDDKTYFISTGNLEDGTSMIQMCEINPFTGEKLTESKVINYGCGGKFPEGPHIYKKDGFYYLMLAEGGTEYGHMETIQRSNNIYGPYEPCPHNPILNHVNDYKSGIYCTGHADLVEDQNGNWWAVCLGTRPIKSETGIIMLHNLGRETFIAPVSWDKNGWPVIGKNGKIALEMTADLPNDNIVLNNQSTTYFNDNFDNEKFSNEYLFIRNPCFENYIKDTKQKCLYLNGTDITLNDALNPTFIGIRQKQMNAIIQADVSLKYCDNENIRAGITAFYNEDYHYEIYLSQKNDKTYVALAKHIHDIFTVTNKVSINSNQNIRLKIKADPINYSFFYEIDGREFLLGTGLTAGLCTESTHMMTFTGTLLGMFSENTQAVFNNLSVTFKREV